MIFMHVQLLMKGESVGVWDIHRERKKERKKEKGSFISLVLSVSRTCCFFSDELQTCNFFNEPLLIHKLQSVVRVVFFSNKDAQQQQERGSVLCTHVINLNFFCLIVSGFGRGGAESYVYKK